MAHLEFVLTHPQAPAFAAPVGRGEIRLVVSAPGVVLMRDVALGSTTIDYGGTVEGWAFEADLFAPPDGGYIARVGIVACYAGDASPARTAWRYVVATAAGEVATTPTAPEETARVEARLAGATRIDRLVGDVHANVLRS